MSGSRRSSRITSGSARPRARCPARPLAASIVRSPAARRTSRASFRFLLVVVDDQDERAAGAALRRRRLEDETSPPYPHAVPIRIVLAEDQYLVREGLRRLLETQDDLEVAAVCGDLDSLLATVDAERPDVVVTDIRMPPGHTDEGSRPPTRLRETNPERRCRRAQPVRGPELRARAPGGRKRGSRLPPEGARQRSRAARRRDPRRRGRRLGARPEGRGGLVAENARGESSPLNELTPRERDVLREMAEGKNNAAIATALVLTERSVEKVIHSIFLKLGLTWETAVHKRVKAVVLYLAESPSVIARAAASRRRGCRRRASARSSAVPPRASTRSRTWSRSASDRALVPGDLERESVDTVAHVDRRACLAAGARERVEPAHVDRHRDLRRVARACGHLDGGREAGTRRGRAKQRAEAARLERAADRCAARAAPSRRVPACTSRPISVEERLRRGGIGVRLRARRAAG